MILSKGAFYNNYYTFNIKNEVFSLKNIQVIDNINSNTLEFFIKLDKDSLNKINNIETLIRKNLINHKCYLKTRVFNNTLKMKISSNKGQIKSKIYNKLLENIPFSDIKKGVNIDLVLDIKKIWCQKDYYPNFIYNFNILEIIIN